MTISNAKLNRMINDILKTYADDFAKYKSLNYELEYRLENGIEPYKEIIMIEEQIADTEKEIILNAVRTNKKHYSYIDKKLIYVYDYKCIHDEERAKIRPHYLPEERILDILANIRKDAISKRKDFGASKYYDLMYFNYGDRYNKDILNPFYGQYLIYIANKQIINEFYTGNNHENEEPCKTFMTYVDKLNKYEPERLSHYLKEDIFANYERLAYHLAKTILTEPSYRTTIAYLISQMNNIESAAQNYSIENCFRHCWWIPNMKTRKIIETLTECKKRAYTRAALGLYSEDLINDYETELNNEEKHSLKLLPLKKKR